MPVETLNRIWPMKTRLSFGLVAFTVALTLTQVMAGPLHDAAFNGELDKMKALLAAGTAGINDPDQDGRTPLHHAASKGHLEIVKLLLEHKADVNVRTKEGYTPAFLAKGLGRQQVLDYLLQNGGTVQIAKTGTTSPTITRPGKGTSPGLALSKDPPIFDLIRKNQAPQIQALLQTNPEQVKSTNRLGETALHAASWRGNSNILEQLLTAGADVNVRLSRSQRTPLFAAIESSEFPIVALLIAHKADVNVIDAEGNMPLDLALQEGRDDVAELLRKNGARQAPAKQLNATEQSLVDFYKNTDKTFLSGTTEEKRKAMLALIPTQEDINKLYLKNNARAWQVSQAQAERMKTQMEAMGWKAPEESEILKCEPKEPSPLVQVLRERKWISPDVPAYCLNVWRKGSMSVTFDYFYVNKKWLMMPPMNQVFEGAR